MNNDNQNTRLNQTDVPGGGRNDDQPRKSNPNKNAENDQGNESEFPGYPHYPPSEDIMNPANQVERVSVDVEKLAPTGVPRNQQTPKQPDAGASETSLTQSTDDEIKIVPGTDADVTREDLRNLNATEGDYANASNNASSVTGEDLDVPGADEDDPSEDIGEEDEENNYYSLGGDNHENLEEDRSV